ncbi:hypothetical protein QBC46DRAFT_399972 [Diplogelasinospora grovesii]|uniref:Small secreted protein n=1 Tax=Diplogelasinospora grovesii TaxID=303347 RepID=A0AAN6MYT2_9PEZI|nr:hypothetical protein QBC46DRAFT_399972 [Diplogelasinospora grovesii]
MYLPTMIPLAALLSTTLTAATATSSSSPVVLSDSEPKYLNLTAISAAHGSSTLECWQFGPFSSSSTPGTTGALNLVLGDMSNASYSVIPPRFDGGLHNAPAPQLVFFNTGLIHITLPNSTDEAWVQGGKYGLIIAADTADKSTHGHRTQYPSDADTIALQVPLKAGERFDYTLLHQGACGMEDMTGL